MMLGPVVGNAFAETSITSVEIGPTVVKTGADSPMESTLLVIDVVNGAAMVELKTAVAPMVRLIGSVSCTWPLLFV